MDLADSRREEGRNHDMIEEREGGEEKSGVGKKTSKPRSLKVPETKIGVICDVEEVVGDKEESMGVEVVEAASESGSDAASV